MAIESSVRRELANRNGKPIQVVDIHDEQQELIDRRRERDEKAEERRLRAKVIGPIEQQLSDVKRERDYYKGLISENKHVSKMAKEIELLKGKYESKISSLEKQISSIKGSNDYDQFIRMKDDLFACRKRIGKLEQEKYDATSALTRTRSFDLTGLMDKAEDLARITEHNKFLETRLDEIVTAYNRLVFLVKQKLGTNAPTQSEIDQKNKLLNADPS